MTIKQLIDHRSGVPHRLLSDSEETVPRTAQEMVEIANRVPLLFRPGDSESYSSGGYAILAAVLERAGNGTYDELLQRYVATPVSAKTIRHVDSRMILPGRASSAIPTGTGSGLINPPLRDLSFLVGAGSVYTTPHDIFLVIRGLVDGVYGKTARDSLMESDGIHWNGEGDGFRTVADWYSADSLTVIYFSNLRLGATDLIRHQIPKIVAGQNVRPPVVPHPKAVALSPAAQLRLVGDYDTGGGDINTVTFASPSLIRWGERFLLAVDDSTFYSFADYAPVRFRSDSTGAVSEIDWGPGTWSTEGQHLHFPKVRLDKDAVGRAMFPRCQRSLPLSEFWVNQPLNGASEPRSGSEYKGVRRAPNCGKATAEQSIVDLDAGRTTLYYGAIETWIRAQSDTARHPAVAARSRP
jgi:hypothetical protein